MDSLQIKNSIKKWAERHLKPFKGSAVFLPYDKRNDALLELFSSLKESGAAPADVKQHLGSILFLCVPKKGLTNKALSGWTRHSADNVLSIYSELFGDPELDAMELSQKVFPKRFQDPSIKKHFVNEALNVGSYGAEPDEDGPTSIVQDTIEEELFKQEYKPIDLSIFKKGEKIKIIRFDPEMDKLLGLDRQEGGDV